jgi:hypothetical protein
MPSRGTVYSGRYSVQWAVQRTVGGTVYSAKVQCTVCRYSGQCTEGGTVYSWRYSVQWAVQCTVGGTAYSGRYSVQCVGTMYSGQVQCTVGGTVYSG